MAQLRHSMKSDDKISIKVADCLAYVSNERPERGNWTDHIMLFSAAVVIYTRKQLAVLLNSSGLNKS